MVHQSVQAFIRRVSVVVTVELATVSERYTPMLDDFFMIDLFTMVIPIL